MLGSRLLALHLAVAFALACVSCGRGCPPDVIAETAQAAADVSTDPTYDFDCDGAVSVNDLLEAERAADECRDPVYECNRD